MAPDVFKYTDPKSKSWQRQNYSRSIYKLLLTNRALSKYASNFIEQNKQRLRKQIL